MKKSCKRTMRQHPGRSRLMPREVEGLVFIAEAQPVATSVYQERLGVSVAVARRSLRKLRNHGLVNVFVTAQEVPSHFALTKRGSIVQVVPARTPAGPGSVNRASSTPRPS